MYNSDFYFMSSSSYLCICLFFTFFSLIFPNLTQLAIFTLDVYNCGLITSSLSSSKFHLWFCLMGQLTQKFSCIVLVLLNCLRLASSPCFCDNLFLIVVGFLCFFKYTLCCFVSDFTSLKEELRYFWTSPL